MSSHPTDSADDDIAGLFALGVLDPDERNAVLRRIPADPALRAQIDAWSRRLMPLEDTRPSVTAPPDAWAAIRDRIGLRGAPTAPTVRLRNQGVWMTLAPGVRMRLLHVEPVTGERSAILTMEAGSEAPAHDHAEAEECFVAAGNIIMDGVHYDAGDHIVAHAQTRHESIVALVDTTLLLHWAAKPA